MNAAQDGTTLATASKALERIYDLSWELNVAPKEPVPPAGGNLFHYTTSEGLKGIIERNELWATSAYYLNDSAEIIYGYGVVKEVLDGWIATNHRSDQSLTLRMTKDLQRSFGEDLLKMNILSPIYLACFCEDGNLLSQWRNYGQSGAILSDSKGLLMRSE